MKCKYCGRELKPDFVYCPYCGEKITKGNPLTNFFEQMDKMIRDMERKIWPSFSKEMEKEIESIEKEVPMRPTTIRFKIITPKVQVPHKPEVKEPKPKEIKSKQTKIKRLTKVSKNVVEPVTSIKRRAGRIYIEVLLPDIKRMEDIMLNELEESIELRAFTKDKTYFKIIRLPPNSNIVDTKFEHGKLLITLM